MEDYKHKIDMRQVMNVKVNNLKMESSEKSSSMNEKNESNNRTFYESISGDVKMRETRISHSHSQ